MTIEDRYLIELKDLKAIRIDCASCGAAVSFRLKDWQTIPTECPGCRVSWHHGEQNDRFKTLSRFSVSVRAMGVMAEQDTPFRLRFEVDKPKS